MLPFSVLELLNEGEERKILAKIMFPFLIQGFARGVDLGTAQGSDEIRPEDMLTEPIKEAIARKAYTESALVIGTTKDKLQEELTEAILQGESVSQLASRIDSLYTTEAARRPILIARTELTGVVSDGTLRTLIEEGYQEKQWRTAIDGRQRKTHESAHLQIVPIRQPFTVGGQRGQAPGDPAMGISECANCRCTLIGAGIPEDRALRLESAFLRMHGALERRYMVSLRQFFFDERTRVLSRLTT